MKCQIDEAQAGIKIADHMWHTRTHSHLWKFATWRFICRGLPVFLSLQLPSLQAPTVQCLQGRLTLLKSTCHQALLLLGAIDTSHPLIMSRPPPPRLAVWLISLLQSPGRPSSLLTSDLALVMFPWLLGVEAGAPHLGSDCTIVTPSCEQS